MAIEVTIKRVAGGGTFFQELRQSEGLGDVIKTVTRTVGMKPCSPCEERRQRFNRLVSFHPLARRREVVKK